MTRIALLVLSLAWSSLAVAQVSVPYERIREGASDDPGNWLTFGGNYHGHRHSKLDHITPANVGKLEVAWVYQARDAGKWEVTPIVIDGVIYVSERPNVVTALDGKTGRPIWSYRRPMPDDVPGCCGPVNRGLAVLGDALYFVTFDCHFVCLDANTGKERWDRTISDYKLGHSMTLAPLAVKDKIIIGISGGDFGIRGFLDAYDATTGERAWRLWTVPAPGEEGAETWGGDADILSKGGAATWVTGTYDPDLNLLYWTTGNPGPCYNGDARPGDNLYTCSVLAIDADSGKLKWHFQFTPHDTHDWDSNQVPVLVDDEIDGRQRKLLVTANRNAFFYVLDRETGEFLRGREFAKQTWAKSLDERGRPIVIPGTEPTAEGALVYPGLEGAVNWPAPSYSPRMKLFYVQAQDDYAQVYYKQQPDHEPGRKFEGGGTRNVLGQEPRGVVKAIEATTGIVRWEFQEQTSSNCAILTTAAGLLFSGTRDGYFYALDDATGKPLWRFQTGGPIHGGPVTFLSAGKQHVAVAAGAGLFVFALDPPSR
jgi:alcohol dehydrogenase (cytochrome c)